MDFNLLISETGIKSATHNGYTSKFKDINWTSRIDQELPIKIQKGEGYGSEQPLTLTQNFFKQIQMFKDQVCMQMKRYSGETGPKSKAGALTSGTLV